MKLPIPIAIPAERHAIARLFVDLSLAFRDSIPAGQRPGAPDANRTLLALAVVMGHASGHPMTAAEITACVRMPRASVLRGLNTLAQRGVIKRIAGRYYLDPQRAQGPPQYMDTYMAIFREAFAVLEPLIKAQNEHPGSSE